MKRTLPNFLAALGSKLIPFKNLCYLLVVLLFSGSAWGQSTANYAFTTNATGSLALDANGNSVDMTTGTTQLVAASQDATVSPVTSVGFNYYFMGNFYSQFTASADGILGLGSTAVSGSTVSGGSTTTPRISALGGDFYVSASGKVHYKLVGSAPSRCLVIEWTGMAVTYNTTAANGNSTWQVRLYETTGVVEYIYGAINCSSTTYNPASAGFSVNTTANNTASITFSNNTVSTGSSFNTNTLALGDVPNLNSTTNGSRRVYKFTPPTPAAGPSNLTFASVAATSTTLNWTAASPTTGIVRYIVQRSNDGGTSYNFSGNVALGTNTFAATGLTPGTSYTWKVVAISEGVESNPALIGTQATTAGATYYWVGATGGNWNTAANWNTLANNTGTTRTAVATTDVLIVDGAGTSAGGAMSISVDLASFSIGQLKVTSSTTLTLASSATTQRVITITGGGGDDFIIENGSSLLLTNTTNPISIIFTGTGNTGDISGILTVAGTSATASAANSFLTTGGTGSIVTVSSTGVINNTATTNIGTNGNVTGSLTSLIFSNGSQYNVSGASTGAFYIPLATWASNSTVTLSGSATTPSTASNNVQSFGNFVVNLPSLTGTLSFWTISTTAVIQGNLVITAAGATGGTGIFRALTSGTLTVNGNVNVLQGRLQSASGAGTFIVLGNTTNSTNGILEINGGTYSQRGTTFTNDGILTGVAGSVRLQFFSTAAQTFAGSGTVLTNIGGLTVENGGLTITHTNQIPTLRVNLFAGTITGSNKITFGTGSANCFTQIGATGLTTPGGSFDAIPTFNLGTGAYNVIYQQESVARTTGFEIPSTRSINALTLSNSNGLTIAGGALSSAALTFSSGCGNITTSSSNVLTITGTTTSAITRTSTTAYVNGPLELTLPASLATGSTYLFPIGKTALYPFELVNPTTGGTVVVRAEVFDGDAGGTAGNIMATLSTSRYWAASVTSGSSNLTNTNIRLTDAATTGFDAIANSATVTGAYDIAGGTTSTVTSTIILSGTPLTSLSGYYLMGSKAAATLATPSITPTGNQCTNVSRAISVLITPGGGAVTTVNLNYSINGSAQTAIAMTNTTNNGGFNADTWTVTLPTVTPANGAITWSITATDANSLTRTINGTGYQDEPNTGITATATATPSTVCDGSNASLSLSLVKSGTGVIGSGTVSSSLSPTPFSGSYGGMKGQYIILASELISAGYSSGNITGLGINFASTVTVTYTDLTIQIGNTSLNAFNSTLNLQSGLTTVYGPTSLVNPVAGVNAFTLTTPFNWDGVSNIIISTSWSNNTTTSTSASVITTTTTSNLAQVHKRDSYLPASLLALTGAQSGGSSTVGTTRPNFTIIGNIPPTPSAYSWSNGTTTLGTTNPLSTPITSGLTYTATATVNGCPMTASVTPTVNPLPTAPTATNSSQCGAGIPTASVADNNSYTTPTFKWYSAATGGTLLQNSTSVTYTTSISATTTFYVAVVGTNTCESTRTAVTITVTQPDAISASTSAAAICLGQSVTLTAANTATAPTQTYSYSWACATTGSGATSANTNNPASVTPTAAGSYTYTVTATDGGCSAVNTVAVTVNALPNITSATATPSAVCSGAAITLTGASVPASSGTGSIGTGTTAEFSYSIFRHGAGNGDYRHQLLYSASELTAAGLVAGQLTSIAFNITTLGSTAYTNYNVSLANVSASSVSTTFNTSTTTQVYLATAFTLVSGVNTFNFGTGAGSSSFTWDGTSSILVNICYTVSGASSTSYVQSSTTSFVSNNQLLGSAGACSASTATGTSTSRPNATFGGQIGTNQTSLYSWSWNSTPAIATATGSTTETNTTSSAIPKTYTVTATNATTGCVNTATTSAISINPATVAPSATNSSQCGTATPTCSVTGTGTSGNTFKWYTVATGGTALSGQTASTLSSYPVSATTSFYVSEFNGTCESARVQVTVTVTAAPTITAAASVNPVCSGSATVLSVTSSNSDYTYTWSNSAGTGASVSVSPTSATNYTVTATDASGGANNGCSTTALVAITTNAVPSAITLTPASASICFGSTQSIVASGGNGALTNLGSLSADAGTIDLEIPDNSTSGISNTLAISSIPSGASITKVDVTFSLTHDWMSDAEITLTAPNGKVIALAADQGSSNSGLYNNVVITSDNTAAALSTTSATITGTYKANATPAAELFGSFGSNLTQTFSDLFSTPNGNWILSAFDDGSGDLGTLNSWSIVITYSENQFSWTPTATLFTDAAATTAYAGSPTTVYAKPTATTTYTATATTAAGCTSSNTVTITVAPTSVAGTVSADQAICSGNSPSDITLSGYTGTIQWQVSTNNSTFTAISGATAATLTTAQMGTLSATRYYRAVVTSGACTAANSSAVTVTVNPLPTTLVLTGSLACAGATGTITSSTSVSGVDYQLYDSANAAVGSVQAGTGSGLTWSSVAIATGYYAKATNATTSCVSSNSNNVAVATITDKTWLGTTSTSWNTASNWSCNAVPVASDVIVISSGSPVLDTNFTVGAGGSLTLSDTGTLTISPTSTLTITGTANFGGKAVTIKSDNTGTGAIGEVTGTNLTGATNVTVERFIPGKRAWRALTAPVIGNTNNSIFYNWQNNGTVTAGVGVELWSTSTTGGNGMGTGPSNSILKYNNSGTTGAWDAITNTNSNYLFDANINNAFMVFVTGPYATTSTNLSSGFANTTLKAKGQLITGTKTYLNLPSGVHTLIGNPYASPLSPSSLLNDNSSSFGNNLWVWDASAAGNYSAGAYNIYEKLANTYTNITNSDPFGTSPDIQSGQAFFVKASSGTATFTISESNKGSAISNSFLRTAAPELFRVGLYKQENNQWSGRDGAITVIFSEANANQDPNKMANSTENIAFTKNGALYASNYHLPLVASDVLNVKVWNTTAGANYKLKINTEQFATTNLDATLEDLFTNARTPLALDGTAVEYPFSVTTDALSTGDRFRIVFQTSTLGTTIPKATGFSIVPNPVTGDSFQVNLGSLATGTYSYSICNALGQEVEKGSINTTTQNTNYTVKFRETAATGIYIMKIKGSDNSVFTAKLIKK